MCLIPYRSSCLVQVGCRTGMVVVRWLLAVLVVVGMRLAKFVRKEVRQVRRIIVCCGDETSGSSDPYRLLWLVGELQVSWHG